MHVANRFLHNAKNFNLSVLQLENPSYAEIAAQMTKISNLIQVMCDDIGDCHTGFKAQEYCQLMVSMAKAITDESQDELQNVINILNGKPFI